MSLPAICLDAGHYGKYNRSPAVLSYYESDMNWKLHLYLKAELEAYGFPVRLTRETQEKDLGLKERGKKAKGCGLFISIHSNATGDYKVNENVDYPIVYYPIDFKGDAIDGKGKDIAEQLAVCIQKTMGTKQAGRAEYRKGTGNWDYLSVINGARTVGVVGILLEHSFHTNTKMTKWLLDDNNLKKMAKEEAKVIAKYYNAIKNDDAPIVENEWYRVRKSWKDTASQLGAYKVLANAIADCPEGYFVFDDNGNAVYPETPSTPVAPVAPVENEWYRVRKSWADAASQRGAYKVLDNAIANCPEGYSVFDDNGNVVYPVSNLPAISILEWQKAAIADGFNFPEYGADGFWGAECESVAAKAVVKKQLIGYKYPNLTKIVQKVVGVKVDGLCGKNTAEAIEKYQKNHGLKADGCVGLNTWKVILNV